MKLLLHTCCGPCLIYPLKFLREKGFEVEGLFFNPNIHPSDEYKRRLKAAEGYAIDSKMTLHIGNYNTEDFFSFIGDKQEKPARCNLCWQLRLGETARFARENKFDYFTTTLLVSPYQDQNLLKQIGSEVEKQSGTKFLYEDFRVGFKEAHAQAKQAGMYCQRYCGCSYSEIEKGN